MCSDFAYYYTIMLRAPHPSSSGDPHQLPVIRVNLCCDCSSLFFNYLTFANRLFLFFGTPVTAVRTMPSFHSFVADMVHHNRYFWCCWFQKRFFLSMHYFPFCNGLLPFGDDIGRPTAMLTHRDCTKVAGTNMVLQRRSTADFHLAFWTKKSTGRRGTQGRTHQCFDPVSFFLFGVFDFFLCWMMWFLFELFDGGRRMILLLLHVWENMQQLIWRLDWIDEGTVLLMAFRSKYSQMLIKTERIDKEERLLMLWVPGSHYLVAIIFDRSNCPRAL